MKVEVDKEHSVEVYTGDSKRMKYEPKLLDVLGHWVQIAELQEVSFMELLQTAVLNVYEKNPYHYEEDRIIAFLFWYDNYLFTFDGFSYSKNEDGTSSLYISNFLYTTMTKYKDVINEEVFGRRMDLYVIKTTRPILTRIIEQIKRHSCPTVRQE